MYARMAAKLEKKDEQKEKGPLSARKTLFLTFPQELALSSLAAKKHAGYHSPWQDHPPAEGVSTYYYPWKLYPNKQNQR